MVYGDESDGYLAERDSLMLALSVLESLNDKSETLIAEATELLNTKYLDDKSRGHIADFLNGLADLSGEGLEPPLAALTHALELHQAESDAGNRHDHERGLGVDTVALDLGSNRQR